MRELIPADWATVLAPAIDSPSFEALTAFVAEQRRTQTVYPAEANVFNALKLTKLRSVRAVILGQDPYHGPGQAHGLSFSVPAFVKHPPSLVNIRRELAEDIGDPLPPSGSLVPWARHGVLLLNTILTVRAGQPGSHAGHGWEAFSDAVIRAVVAKQRPVLFMLWGGHAQAKRSLITNPMHPVLERSHPSGYSARINFLGTRPFSSGNAALRVLGAREINWDLR